MGLREKIVSEKTLENYARALGPRSLAAECLREYREDKDAGMKVQIVMANNGFRLVCRGDVRRFG